MVLHIGRYGDVLRTFHWNVLRKSYFNFLRTSVEDVVRASVGDVPWHYIEDHMGTCTGRVLGTFSGRPRDVLLPSGMLTDCLYLEKVEGEV